MTPVFMMRPLYRLLLGLCTIIGPAAIAAAQTVPSASLARATPSTLTGQVDSSSPTVWDEDGILHVFTSYAGLVSVASGTSTETLEPAQPVVWVETPPGGVWMEGVIVDNTGVFYGYYHNELPATECLTRGAVKARPRIGAARSVDRGRTWEDLGVILESPEASQCNTTNQFFVGGVGDFSVVLDRDEQYLYVVYTDYSASFDAQGVSMARMLWASRDEPVGALAVWQSGLWLPATSIVVSTNDDETEVELEWSYPEGSPVYQAQRSWHGAGGRVDAFWGPTVHWNSYLEQHVMLLTRANSGGFGTEGIYVVFTPTLENPETWSMPQKVMSGGGWYPQVIGLPAESGTDKHAGQQARFYLAGSSAWTIEFVKPDLSR